MVRVGRSSQGARADAPLRHPDHPGEFVSWTEALALLGFDANTMRRHLKTGKVIPPDRRISPRVMFWRRSRLLAWLAGQSDSNGKEAARA
jgi:predicted DNA-binding transcriptional regulator AlpA